MRRNAVREKQFTVSSVVVAVASAARSTIASNKVLRMEIKDKWSGDEPGIRR